MTEPKEEVREIKISIDEIACRIAEALNGVKRPQGMLAKAAMNQLATQSPESQAMVERCYIAAQYTMEYYQQQLMPAPVDEKQKIHTVQ